MQSSEAGNDKEVVIDIESSPQYQQLLSTLTHQSNSTRSLSAKYRQVMEAQKKRLEEQQQTLSEMQRKLKLQETLMSKQPNVRSSRRSTANNKAGNVSEEQQAEYPLEEEQEYPQARDEDEEEQVIGHQAQSAEMHKIHRLMKQQQVEQSELSAGGFNEDDGDYSSTPHLEPPDDSST